MNRFEAWERAACDWLRDNIVHRGQWCGSDGLRTALPTIAFGTERAAKIYARSPNDKQLAKGLELRPRVFAARLDVRKVYCRTAMPDADPYLDLDVIGSEFGRDVLLAIVAETRDAIEDTGGFIDLQQETGLDLAGMIEAWPDHMDRLPPVPAYLALQVEEFVDALKAAGYDAAGFGGSGETALEMEWHIFDSACASCAVTGDPFPGPEPAEEEMPCP